MKNKLAGKEVVVSNIPQEADEEELRKLFSVCGSVRSIKRLSDADGHFYGKAFIRMASSAEARDAINMLDGARLLSRCIRVSAPRQESAPANLPAETESRPKKNRDRRRKR